MARIGWRGGLLAIGSGLIATAAGALLPPNTYIPPRPWLMSVDTNHRAPDLYQLPPPRDGLVVEGFDYSGEGGLPWQSNEVAAAARKACPGGDANFIVPEGVMLSEGADQAVIVPFVLIASGHEALLLRRFPEITGSNGCTLSVRYRGTIDRAIESDGTVTTFFDLGSGKPVQVRSDRAEEGRNGLFDNLLLPITDLAQERLHQPRGGTAKMQWPIDGIKSVCFDMSSKTAKAHECYLDDDGPWRGLALEIRAQRPNGGIAGTQVYSVRQGIPIEGRLFEWDRPITLEE